MSKRRLPARRRSTTSVLRAPWRYVLGILLAPLMAASLLTWTPAPAAAVEVAELPVAPSPILGPTLTPEQQAALQAAFEAAVIQAAEEAAAAQAEADAQAQAEQQPTTRYVVTYTTVPAPTNNSGMSNC